WCRGLGGGGGGGGGSVVKAGGSGDGGDLRVAASRLGQAAGSGLTEPGGAAMTQARHVTLLTEPLTEIARRERPAELIGQESQMMGWCLGDNSSKHGVNRNREFDARFLLTDMQHAVAHMLRPHPHNV